MRALLVALLLVIATSTSFGATPGLRADHSVEQCRRPSAELMLAALVVSNESDCVCGTKTKCGQMDSCAEARCFLEKCGVKRLDGDGDGTPCEAICG